MNRRLVVILFIVIVGGGIAALVIYAQQFAPKYSWAQQLYKKSDQPYGLNLFYEVLKNQEKGLKTIDSPFTEELDTNKTNTTFISIGSYLYIDSLKANHILKYVKNGNNVFIASNEIPVELFRPFFFLEDSTLNYSYYYDSLITVSFKKEEIPYPRENEFHHQHLKDTTRFAWAGIHIKDFNLSFKSKGFKPLSYIKDTVVNCFYIQYGAGKIYFNSTPILSTNYYLIQKNGFEYTNNILSTFNIGEIYWDETSLNPSTDRNRGINARDNPLQLLFSHYTLRWGWYLFLITVFLYLLFRSKREQRIIPLMPKNNNTTIAYTKAVGVLYFQEKEHKNIAKEMYAIFLSEVRSRYHITTNVEEKELIQKISDQSGPQRH